MNEIRENSAIELHDSTLARVDQVDGRIEVDLAPAYIHKTSGVCGVDPGTEWVQTMLLIVDGGVVEGKLPELPCDLWSGALIVDGCISENILALPLDHSGVIALRLDPCGADPIIVRGTRIEASPKNDAVYVQDFK